MESYSMTCSCGHTDALLADNREQAVETFKQGMTQEALDQHFAQHHQPSDTKPSLDQARQGIELMVAATA